MASGWKGVSNTPRRQDPLTQDERQEQLLRAERSLGRCMIANRLAGRSLGSGITLSICDSALSARRAPTFWRPAS